MTATLHTSLTTFALRVTWSYDSEFSLKIKKTPDDSWRTTRKTAITSSVVGYSRTVEKINTEKTAQYGTHHGTVGRTAQFL